MAKRKEKYEEFKDDEFLSPEEAQIEMSFDSFR